MVPERDAQAELQRAAAAGAAAVAQDPGAAKIAAGGAIIGGAVGYGLGRGLGEAAGEHLSSSVEQLVRCVERMPANVRKELMDGASIQGLLDDIKRDADHLIESVGLEREKLERTVRDAGRQLIDETVLKITVVGCIAAVAVLATKVPHLAEVLHDPTPVGVAKLWAFVITPGWVMFLAAKVRALLSNEPRRRGSVFAGEVFLHALAYVTGFGAVAAVLVAALARIG